MHKYLDCGQNYLGSSSTLVKGCTTRGQEDRGDAVGGFGMVRVTSLSPLSLVEHKERPLSPTATSHCALTSSESSERGLAFDTDLVLNQFNQFDDEHVRDYENLVVVTSTSTSPPVPPHKRGSSVTARRQSQMSPPVLPTRDPQTFGVTMGNRLRATRDEYSNDVNPHDSECGSLRAASTDSTPENKTLLDEKFNSPSSSRVLSTEQYRESCAPIRSFNNNNNKTPNSKAVSDEGDAFEEEEQRDANSNTTDEEEEEKEILRIRSGGNWHASAQGGRGGDMLRARKPLEVSFNRELGKPLTIPTNPLITVRFKPVSIAPVAGPSSPIVFRPVLEDDEFEVDQEETEKPIKEEVTMMESPSQTRVFSPKISSHHTSNTREFSISKALTREQLVGGMVGQPVPTRIEVGPPTPTDSPLPPMLDSQPMARVSGVRKGAQELDGHFSRVSAAPVRPPSGASNVDYIDYHFERQRVISSQLNTDHQF